MNTASLREHIKNYLNKLQKEKTKHEEEEDAEKDLLLRVDGRLSQSAQAYSYAMSTSACTPECMAGWSIKPTTR
jgi:hypothetical protein